MFDVVERWSGQASQVTASVSAQYINPAALQPEADAHGDDSRVPVSETQVCCAVCRVG